MKHFITFANNELKITFLETTIIITCDVSGKTYFPPFKNVKYNTQLISMKYYCNKARVIGSQLLIVSIDASRVSLLVESIFRRNK